MQLERVPMYLQDVTFTTERVKEGEDETSKRIVVLVCRVQPFTRDLAATLTPGLVSKLFAATGEPTSDLLACEVALVAPLVTIQMATAIDADPSFEATDAKVTPKVTIRRDKETPTYAATLRLNFAYPSAKDLLFLVHAINQQIVVTLLGQQIELKLDADEQGDADNEPVSTFRRGRASAAAH